MDNALNIAETVNGNIDIRPVSTDVRAFPQQIKYMGSKAKLASFVADSIASVYSGGVVCDLFAGSGAISGALGAKYKIHSNDIQSYSKHLASVYLHPSRELNGDEIISDARRIYRKIRQTIPETLSYPTCCTLEEFNAIEKQNRTLFDRNFNHRYHLFLKYYSGTWWSAEQCLWIDAIKQVIDKKFRQGVWGAPEYSVAMTVLMYAMAYSSQGTGHYAQYRDANTESGMKDINLYRQKDVATLFRVRMDRLYPWIQQNVVDLGHTTSTLDYVECLRVLKGGVIYADPPYAFVHYSRFYHAMETICLYDYPIVQKKMGEFVKGRYREGRHQSPFCIKSQVCTAFESLFSGAKNAGSNLALSYSNTAMIGPVQLLDIASVGLGESYDIWLEDRDHKHMTMGRQADRDREVKELMLLARKK